MILPTLSPEPTISPIPPSCNTTADVVTILLTDLIEGHIYKVDFKINSKYYPVNTYPESVTFKANSSTKYVSTILRYSR